MRRPSRRVRGPSLPGAARIDLSGRAMHGENQAAVAKAQSRRRVDFSWREGRTGPLAAGTCGLSSSMSRNGPGAARARPSARRAVTAVTPSRVQLLRLPVQCFWQVDRKALPVPTICVQDAVPPRRPLWPLCCLWLLVVKSRVPVGLPWKRRSWRSFARPAGRAVKMS